MRPDSKRIRPGREPEPEPGPEPDPEPGAGLPAAAAANGGARAHERAWFPPNRARNSKYPKGTPFVLNFLYLNTTNFHPMVNVGLNTFSYL